MIVSFAKDLFDTGDDKNKKDLATLLGLILEEKCFVTTESIYQNFYNDLKQFDFEQGSFAKLFLSQIAVKDLKEYVDVILVQSAYLNADQRKYFTHFTIGYEEGQINPNLAVRILQEPSKVILENATNDWDFIKGIIIKYANNKKRKTVYKQLLKSLDKKWIISEQAGGKGQIISRIKDLSSNRYEHIPQYKLMVIMDSDRSKPNDLTSESKKIIEFLKNNSIPPALPINESSDVLIWHILYKREIENYVPLEVLQENLKEEISGLNLQEKSELELDFIKFQHILPEVAVKSIFPKLFLVEFTRDKMEKRCNHHFVSIQLPNGTLEQVSEPEEILLKIAKII